MENNIQILITSSEDDNEGISNEKKKKKRMDWDLDGCDHIKALIEARACTRRKKRKKKKKKNNGNSQIVEIQAQGQVDAAIKEQQVGEPNAIETTEVTETELVFVTGNTTCQEVPALTTTSALPSSTIESSMSTQISSNVKIVSRNLLAELSSRSKTLNSPLNNETCSPSLVFGSDLQQQQRKAMASFLDMSLEDIYHTNSFDNVERTALTLIQYTSNPLEKSTLEDLISHLAQFKENVPNAITLFKAASIQRMSLLDKTKTLDAILDQNQDQLSSLEAEFSKLEEAAIEVEDQIQRLITKKEELLFRRNSVALKLERTNQEASRALGEWRSLEKENEEISDTWLRASTMLVQFNNTWKLFRNNLNL